MSDTALRNAPADDGARLMQAAREALTDSMIERLSITGANALEILDRFNEPSTKGAIHGALDKLVELHRVGALDTLFDLVALVHAVRSASTDNIVERLFAFCENIVNTVATEDMAAFSEKARLAFDAAAAECAGMPARTGLLGTLAILRDPNCQRSLRFFLAFAQKFQEGATAARSVP